MYMDHRRYLPHDHMYRKKKKVFNGKTEDRKARLPLRGATVYSRVEKLNITFGKVIQKIKVNVNEKEQYLPQIFGRKDLYFGIYHTGKTYMSDIVLTLCISRKMFVKVWLDYC